MFHSPDRGPDLEDIRSVEILHAPDGERRVLLFAGWLSSSLGWTPKRTRRDGDGFSFQFDSESGEVEIRISPSSDAALLSNITLKSSRREFEISRPREMKDEVRVQVTEGDQVSAESVARLGSFDTSAMLALSLKSRGQDRAYARSVRRILEILEA